MAKFLTAIPDPDSGWTIYSGQRPNSGGRDLHEAAEKRAGLLVGVPVAKAPTFSVLVPTTDSSLLREMAFAQIEKRGLSKGSIEDTIFDHDVLEQEGGQTRLAVHVFDTPLPDDLILNTAAGYAPSPLVRERVHDGAVLWKENRKLTIAIFRGGWLVHSQVLTGAPEVSVATAQEINFLMLSLQGDPAFEDTMPEKLAVVLDDISEQDRKQFAEAVNLDCAFTEKSGADRKAQPRARLTPSELTQWRNRKKSARWIALGSVVLLAVYFLVGVFMWKRAQSHKRQVAALERAIRLVDPDVYHIQEIDNRWKAMEPAFDMKWFPVVQLSRITEALPGTGVVIREYETRGRDIYLQGQARDVQLAFRLEEDLANLPGFEHYQWSMPKPSMNSDNTASFKIEGKPSEE